MFLILQKIQNSLKFNKVNEIKENNLFFDGKNMKKQCVLNKRIHT